MKAHAQYATVVKVVTLCKFGGVGPRLFSVLVNELADLDAIVSDGYKLAGGLDGVEPQVVEALRNCRELLPQAEAYCARLADRDIGITTRFDREYPTRLMELNDPPPLLYVRGKLPDNETKTVTLMGTRQASNEGIALTVQLAQVFAQEGVQIVASLERGIDAAAHVGSRGAGGESFALADAGFDHIERSQAVPISIDVIETGGVISEYDPEQTYDTSHFMASNRLLVGLPHAVVITELYGDSQRVLDVLSFCSQIGKMVFLVTDPKHGALSDEAALDKATECGVIPMVGLDKADSIIAALV